jgi:hypothetical protein
MVARLKLKEIDGRAPQGVSCNSAPIASPLWRVSWMSHKLLSVPKRTDHETLRGLSFGIPAAMYFFNIVQRLN